MQDNQQKQLFTELTPEQAATVEGGQVWIASSQPVNFQYWDSTSQSWTPASAGPGASWTWGAPGQTTTIYYDYAPGPDLDDFITKDLIADNYYVFVPNPPNGPRPGWYDLYLSDPTFTQIGSRVGYPAGIPLPN